MRLLCLLLALLLLAFGCQPAQAGGVAFVRARPVAVVRFVAPAVVAPSYGLGLGLGAGYGSALGLGAACPAALAAPVVQPVAAGFGAAPVLGISGGFVRRGFVVRNRFAVARQRIGVVRPVVPVARQRLLIRVR